MSAAIQGLFSLVLKNDGHTLEYCLADDNGNKSTGTLDLNIYLENIDGTFSWGGKGNWSRTGRKSRLEVDPKTNNLYAELQKRNQSWSSEQSINLGERLYNINGHLTYLEYHKRDAPTGGPELEGDIDGRTFAVASDGPNNICRIAYKTVLNNKISFAEVKFENGFWSLPKEIALYKDAVPGQNIAYTVDPEDSDKRHFFFCEETGDGALYYQSYTNRKWGRPEKLGYKAHRFSKFAAAYCNSDGIKVLLFYYVTESNVLQELVGAPKTGGGFTWYAYNVPATKDLPANTFLALSQREKETILVHRAPGTNDVSIRKTSSRATIDDDEPYRAKWEKNAQVLVKNADVVRNSPLAVVHRYLGQYLTLFYCKRDGRDKTIYAQDFVRNKNLTYDPLKQIFVGKLQSESILGAASFQKDSVYDARLFSVSSLDGDDILIERIPKFYYKERVWVISGGIVDTDADALDACSEVVV